MLRLVGVPPSVTTDGLTDGRVPYSSGGKLVDDADLTFNGTTLTLGTNGILAITKTTGTTVAVSSTQASTSTATGAVTVAGGVGVAGAANIGSTLAVTGSSTFSSQATFTGSGVVAAFRRTDNTSASQGNLTLERGTGAGTRAAIATTGDAADGVASLQFEVGGSIRLEVSAAGALSLAAAAATHTISSTTASSSTTTGALIVAGGIATGANSYIGGTLVIQKAGNSTVELTTTVSGSTRAIYFRDTAGSKYNWLAGAQNNIDQAFEITPSTAAGGATYSSAALSIAAATRAVTCHSTTASTTTGTGALVVAGGVGVAGAMNVGSSSVATGIAATASSVGATLTVSDAGTTNQPFGLYVDHTSSGTPAAGFGVSLGWRAKSDTTNSRVVGQVLAQWAVATDASRTGRLRWFATDATADREFMRGEASGTAAMIGFLGAAATVRTAITGSRGGNAALAALLTELAAKGLITDSTTA